MRRRGTRRAAPRWPPSWPRPTRRWSGWRWVVAPGLGRVWLGWWESKHATPVLQWMLQQWTLGLAAAWQGWPLVIRPARTALPAPSRPPLRPPQADLQVQREKVRRKAAIVARQEEELTARDRAADEAQQRARGLQRELERAAEDAGAPLRGGG